MIHTFLHPLMLYCESVFINSFEGWVVIGFIGQLCFMMRFLVQWWASERAGRSLIPIAFWYFSILGSAILCAYAVWRRDPVFILGQGPNIFIYCRNLILIAREKRQKEVLSIKEG